MLSEMSIFNDNELKGIYERISNNASPKDWNE